MQDYELLNHRKILINYDCRKEVLLQLFEILTINWLPDHVYREQVRTDSQSNSLSCHRRLCLSNGHTLLTFRSYVRKKGRYCFVTDSPSSLGTSGTDHALFPLIRISVINHWFISLFDGSNWLSCVVSRSFVSWPFCFGLLRIFFLPKGPVGIS